MVHILRFLHERKKKERNFYFIAVEPEKIICMSSNPSHIHTHTHTLSLERDRREKKKHAKERLHILISKRSNPNEWDKRGKTIDNSNVLLLLLLIFFFFVYVNNASATQYLIGVVFLVCFVPLRVFRRIMKRMNCEWAGMNYNCTIFKLVLTVVCVCSALRF